MTMEQIRREFIALCYDGDKRKYSAARKEDYCKVQLEWSYFIDCLCKNGVITQKQYDRATF